MAEPSSARVDSWIWAVRLTKTRSLATAACKAGHVRVNGERVKASQAVKIGDTVRVRSGERERTVEVARIVVKRVGAGVAADCVVDRTPPPPPKELATAAGVRDRGTGRPTKRDRRDLERLRGY